MNIYEIPINRKKSPLLINSKGKIKKKTNVVIANISPESARLLPILAEK